MERGRRPRSCYNTLMLFASGKGSKPEISFGVVLDIGSGSVGVAIVASALNEKLPSILWSYREYLPDGSSDMDTKNRISTTILNVFLELGGTGLKILRDMHPGKLPSIIQVSFNAPFAYTISRNVLTNTDKPIRINSKVLSSLESRAKEEAKKQVTTALATKATNLAILSEVVTSVKIDGYPVQLPYNGEGKTISLRQLISLAPDEFIGQIESVRDKILPKAQIDFDSFLSLYSRAVLDLVSFKKDIGLISITAKASEMMIISDGEPRISNFLTKGHHSLATSISQISGLDISESLGIMKDNDVDYTKSLSETKMEDLKKTISNYEDELTAFFRSMGDSLIIPKDIYLQVDKNYELFFVNSLSRSLSKATGLKHTVHRFTSQFFNFSTDTDSRLLCSAYIFHKKLYSDQLAEDRYLL